MGSGPAMGQTIRHQDLRFVTTPITAPVTAQAIAAGIPRRIGSRNAMNIAEPKPGFPGACPPPGAPPNNPIAKPTTGHARTPETAPTTVYFNKPAARLPGSVTALLLASTILAYSQRPVLDSMFTTFSWHGPPNTFTTGRCQNWNATTRIADICKCFPSLPKSPYRHRIGAARSFAATGRPPVASVEVPRKPPAYTSRVPELRRSPSTRRCSDVQDPSRTRSFASGEALTSWCRQFVELVKMVQLMRLLVAAQCE